MKGYSLRFSFKQEARRALVSCVLPTRAHVLQKRGAGPGPEQPEGPSGNHDYQRPASVPGLGQGTGWRDSGGWRKGKKKQEVAGEGKEIEKTQQLLPDEKGISEPCILGNQVMVVAGWGVGGSGMGQGEKLVSSTFGVMPVNSQQSTGQEGCPPQVLCPRGT